MTQTIQERKAQVQRDAKTFKALSGREASELHRNDPAQYNALRAAAVETGVLHGGNGYRQPGLHVQHYVETHAPISTAEIKARIQFPEAIVRKYYQVNQNDEDAKAFNLGKLAQEHPEQYQALRLAAMSFNVIERSEIAPARKPVAPVEPVDDRLILGEKLGQLAGLPADTKVKPEELFELNEHANALDRAKA